MPMNDLTEVYENYKGEWVALNPKDDSVIAHGKEVKDVWKSAKAIISKPVLLEIPLDFLPFIG
jgi:hypothetical protein